jgi:hypothetical protein
LPLPVFSIGLTVLYKSIAGKTGIYIENTVMACNQIGNFAVNSFSSATISSFWGINDRFAICKEMGAKKLLEWFL